MSFVFIYRMIHIPGLLEVYGKNIGIKIWKSSVIEPVLKFCRPSKKK